MKKKLYVVLTLFSLLVLGACSKQADNQNEILKVGVEASYPPYEFMQDGKLNGFDIDIIKELAKRVNFKIEFVNMSYDALIPALMGRKIDLAISSMGITPQRAQNVDFSISYFKDKNVYLKHKDNDFSQKDDLKSKNICVLLGSIQENAAKQILNAKVIASENILNCFLSLDVKKNDVVVTDKASAMNFLKQYPNIIAFYEEDDGSDGFGIAFRKNEFKDLISKVNQHLEEMKKDGTLEKLLVKYNLKD
ncbi:TPA: transporter substrate-binding domain-containing protein [Campylobacter lari subsp. concheus]|uniref:transporter substrate-binding domain-containing protein n=1 Tax=Campylobacter TaxID=194 RepID=UPI00128462D2|nr:transporter substrate-binding domain-containing protein [Campylobacter lari]EHZ4884830.1 transporter substrate-binding domain-containing protein [Campylobacter lari]MBT0815815.1 transporter substrate-binding domain-containing protein [Campylobacter lari]MCR8685945.1 transporter substrate-binding domain-containing protein [Campylobacter sp. 1569]